MGTEVEDTRAQPSVGPDALRAVYEREMRLIERRVKWPILGCHATLAIVWLCDHHLGWHTPLSGHYLSAFFAVNTTAIALGIVLTRKPVLRAICAGEPWVLPVAVDAACNLAALCRGTARRALPTILERAQPDDIEAIPERVLTLLLDALRGSSKPHDVALLLALISALERAGRTDMLNAMRSHCRRSGSRAEDAAVREAATRCVKTLTARQRVEEDRHHLVAPADAPPATDSLVRPAAAAEAHDTALARPAEQPIAPTDQ